MKKTVRKQLGFTLLEVLIVVAMLAIVGGAIITSYGGLEQKAATSTGVHSLAAVKNAFTVFQVSEGVLPNNLESLLAATPTTPVFEADIPDNAAEGATAGAFAAHLSSSLQGKFTVTDVDPEPLLDAGITMIRYMDLAGNATTDGDHDLAIKGADGQATAVENVLEMDIPSHAFELPLSTDGNRGRGYHVEVPAVVTAGGTIPMAVWNAGDNGYNNLLVGASKTSVLVGLGLGDSSSLVGGGTFTNLGDAPYHGGVAANQYNHYIALIDVSVEPARFVSVVCPNGHIIEAEFAESRGGGGHGHDH
ncbi:MAG: prepilin-type N-terminal cleavage/methylation domain-containing protein [Planctomycetaceae bacterium]